MTFKAKIDSLANTIQYLAYTICVVLLFSSAPAEAQTATGGNTADVTVGGVPYRIHTFTSSGSFVVTGSIPTIEYLIIAGGGGGGATRNSSNLPGSGGGAGGFLQGTTTNLSGSYPIVIGLGGAGAPINAAASGSNGGDSSAFGFTATGGGAGASRSNDNSAVGTIPGNGGSGGGSAFGSPPGTGVVGQGFVGGISNTVNGSGFSGGGGGAGGAGGSFSAGGVGGTGAQSTITGTSTYYAGGGGRGLPGLGGSAGAGGQGGGGDGGSASNGGNGQEGAANTGGGGGGGRAGSQGSGAGGFGGSGVVILRYSLGPEIDVTSSQSGAVADGGIDPQGNILVRATGATTPTTTITYTVKNNGASALMLSGTPTVSNLMNVDNNIIVGAIGALSLNAGASTTFDVTYATAGAGPFSFDIDIGSNDSDESAYDITVSGTGNPQPTVVLTAPSAVQTGPFDLTATFSEPVSGVALSDFVIGNAIASNLVVVSASVYTIRLSPVTAGAPISITLPANSAKDAASAMNAASNTLNISTGALTNAQRDEIRKVILGQTIRALRGEIRVNQRANRSARERFVAAQKCGGLNNEAEGSNARTDENCRDSRISRGSVPLSFDGALQAFRHEGSLIGSFFGTDARSNKTTRIMSGNFDVEVIGGRDMRASLNGRLAWEYILPSDMMVGYFLGANAAHSHIDGTLSGSNLGYGVTVGAYVVDEVTDGLYWDGFLAFGAGRNNLDLGNGTFNVSSGYSTTAVQTGVAISGVTEFKSFQLRPEINLALGYSDIDNVDLSVTFATTTLSDAVDVGRVILGGIAFRQELIVPLSVNSRIFGPSEFGITPSLTCEYLRTTSESMDCGGGLELQWSTKSNEALGQFSATLSREMMGKTTTDRFGLNSKIEF